MVAYVKLGGSGAEDGCCRLLVARCQVCKVASGVEASVLAPVGLQVVQVHLFVGLQCKGASGDWFMWSVSWLGRRQRMPRRRIRSNAGHGVQWMSVCVCERMFGSMPCFQGFRLDTEAYTFSSVASACSGLSAPCHNYTLYIDVGVCVCAFLTLIGYCLHSSSGWPGFLHANPMLLSS